MNLTDTIAAVSTPRGKGGIALIRISGHDALEIAARVFRPKNGKPLADIASRQAVYGDIYIIEPDGSPRRADDGLAVIYRAPASFTGEDTIELTCHGGVLITQAVLEAVFCAGARPAGAGEFTRRAFVAGKIGLSEAEALGLLLEAKTHGQLRLARAGMDGALSREVQEMYGELRGLVAGMFARIDFPDEDLSGISRQELCERVGSLLCRLRRLAATYRTGKAISEGVRTVICGRTNSGKSSIYNRILGYEAAIVTDIAGTTRDVLESTVSFGGVTLHLLDTAGLRESSDRVELIGIERARREAERAELVLAVFDISRQADDEDRRFAEYISSLGSPVIAVLNKIDLPPVPDALLELNCAAVVRVSALSGEGMDELARTVRNMFVDGSIDLSQDAVIASARQYAALSRAAELVSQSQAALLAGLPEDICCSDLELAMSALAEVDRHEVTSDIVEEIFAKFCVGK
ncbi:MAG TPA: tRNA uridine-5-carboxymethylaminomethyl(34) synthesis GTPase MnmE [Clostridiales bacterium]|nr:tRNA uridine-5-carboxymethylaminomethyl(34) synthesis GTPase MnmE [Clostridiales bacterium]